MSTNDVKGHLLICCCSFFSTCWVRILFLFCLQKSKESQNLKSKKESASCNLKPTTTLLSYKIKALYWVKKEKMLFKNTRKLLAWENHFIAICPSCLEDASIFYEINNLLLSTYYSHRLFFFYEKYNKSWYL